MNCQFCEDYEWSKKHRPKTGRELYTKYYVCLYERTLRKGCGHGLQQRPVQDA